MKTEGEELVTVLLYIYRSSQDLTLLDFPSLLHEHH